MGRLENFIPMMKVTLDKQPESLFVSSPGKMPVAVHPELHGFLKNLNGHLSLKEVFSFLNRKQQATYIEKSLNTLLILAKKGFLANGDDFIKIFNGHAGSDTGRKKIALENLNAAYFSKERLVALLQKTTLFLKCKKEAAENILKHSKVEHVPTGTKLISEGSQSSYFYVLLSGEVGVFRRGNCLANLSTLSVFGESAAIFNQYRNADVIASHDSWILKIDASQLVDTQSPDSFDAYNGLKSRLILNKTLAANPLFQNMPADVMQLFISKCRLEKHAREQIMFNQGEEGGDFYFILKGSVSVIKDAMPVTSLSEGNHFGEIAAIFHEPRSATIVTESECVFLGLNQKSLFEILSSHFRLAIDIEKTALERKQSTENVLSLFDDSDDTEKPFDEEHSENGLDIDDEFLEITRTNFDLELLDFSKTALNEEAS